MHFQNSRNMQKSILHIIVYMHARASIYLSIGINVRFAAMMADVGDGLL